MLIAVLAGLAAGCAFAVGAVLQQSAAREAPIEAAMSWRLLVDLAHRPKWLLGIASDAGSFGLQALALAFGPIALVQPLLVTGVMFAVPIAVRLRGMRLHLQEWSGTIAVAGGLALFLTAASPSEGVAETTPARWSMLLVAVLGLMALFIVAGRVTSGPYRASLWGVAAGAAFGLLAALTKTATWLLGQGATTFFTAWQPYAMLGVAIAGAIVQQSAFQTAPLPASLPVMDVVEPTVAVLIGVFAFDEALSTSIVALACEALGIVSLLVGIVLLDRSPVVLALQREAHDHRAATGPAAPDSPVLCE